MKPLQRHDWAFLRTDAPLALGACTAAVRAWIEEHVVGARPLVVARQAVPPGRVALGAVTPPRLGRVRVACTVAASDVARVRGPVAVAEAAGVLPPAAAAVLADLCEALARRGARIGVYGSTAWSFFTGEDCRHAGSDIDVVCDVADASAVDGCLGALQAAARALPCRLDGEIRFACGRAVAWRELAAARDEGLPLVLAKGAHEVGMAPLRELVAGLR